MAEPGGTQEAGPAPGGPTAAEGAAEDADALDCVICFSPYDRLFKVPKALGCGHVFCLECLARLHVTLPHGQALPCPVCREPTRLPARWGTPGLPTHHDPLGPAPAAASVRFSRRRGLLYVAGPPKGRGLPKPLGTVSLSVDVGWPPPRVRGGGALAWGRWPFAMAVGLAVALAVGLVVSGVYIFNLLPAAAGPGPGPSNATVPNGTQPPSPPGKDSGSTGVPNPPPGSGREGAPLGGSGRPPGGGRGGGTPREEEERGPPLEEVGDPPGGGRGGGTPREEEERGPPLEEVGAS